MIGERRLAVKSSSGAKYKAPPSPSWIEPPTPATKLTATRLPWAVDIAVIGKKGRGIDENRCVLGRLQRVRDTDRAGQFSEVTFTVTVTGSLNAPDGSCT